MKAKDVFARFAGGTAGAIAALTVPHIGCLAALTPIFVSVGGGAALATGATYAAGALVIAGGVYAAWYGLRPSREACCLVFGETRRVRLMKGAAMAGFAFAAIAAVNSALDSKLAIADRAVFLEAAHNNGDSVWDQQKSLDLSCLPDKPWWARLMPRQ